MAITTEFHYARAGEAVQNGQCGLCTHFGEHHKTDLLVTIRTTHQADLKIVDECGHPKHSGLHLKVTPISGCDGFAPAAAADRLGQMEYRAAL